MYGIDTKTFGLELRAQVGGNRPGEVSRGRGRVRRPRAHARYPAQPPGQFIRISSQHKHKLVRLSDVARPGRRAARRTSTARIGAAHLRSRADVAPDGRDSEGNGRRRRCSRTEVKLPAGYATSMSETRRTSPSSPSHGHAIGLSVLFIYLVLSSLYESFVTPFAIMLALAAGGVRRLLRSLLHAPIGEYLLDDRRHHAYSGVATKNSILLVDYANHLIAEGMDRSTALDRRRQDPAPADSDDDDGAHRGNAARRAWLNEFRNSAPAWASRSSGSSARRC